jgi:glycerophosphoryl diester phosphodiesterase
VTKGRAVVPIVVSHRTNRGTAAENTLAGIESAIVDGAQGVEVDVRATRDGELVLMHDASLLRTTGDPRFLNEVAADEASRSRRAALGTRPPVRSHVSPRRWPRPPGARCSSST